MRPLNGYVDAEGRLIAGDQRLLALNVEAGGSEGGTLAVPQLASLARIARSLAIPVARPVIIAVDNKPVEVLARAKLQDDVVQLTLADIDEAKSLALSIDANDPQRAADYASLERECRWETDSQLRFTHVSPAFAPLFEEKLPVLDGKSFGSIFALERGPDGDMPILAALARHEAFAGQSARIGDKKLVLSGEAQIDAAGYFTGYQGIARLAGRDDAEKAGKASQLSEVANRLDSALRGPIGRIVHNADAIHRAQEGELRPEYQGYGSDIASAGRHLLGLVDDLADLQAIERADFRIMDEAVDLADIARRAAGLLSVRASEKRVKLDCPDKDEQLPARGEFRRVLQIMVNLVSNAVRYSPEDSMVWIRTECDGDLAVVIVADLGKGIAAEDQGRIFEKFERVDPSEPGGSGIGLYIARRLARAMGGDITVDSAPGLGARFALTLPADLM